MARRLLSAACALLCLILAGDAQGPAPAQGGLAQLLRSSAAQDGLSALLASLGDERVPELFTALLELEAAPDGGAGGVAAAVREDLLRARGPALLRHLRALVWLPFVEPERRLGVSLLGESGAASEVRLLLELASTGAPAPTPGPLRAEFERSLLRVLARQAEGLQELPNLIALAPVDLLEGLVASAGALNSEAALQALGDALGARPAADQRILSEIGRLGSAVTHPVSPAVRQAVSRLLAAQDPLVQVAAMDAVASLGDVDAFPALIEILRHDRGLAAFADAALRRLSGKAFKGNARAWEAWYAGQVTWWKESSSAHLDAVASGDARAAAQALHDLGGQCLFRHELAKGLAPGLLREETELVLLVCSKLASLGSTTVVPELVALLDHDRPEVRAGAHRALCQITGRHLPADAASWLAYESP